MMKFLARILCAATGHARGIRTSTENGVGQFKCPKCDATWTRKDRKKA